MKKQMHNSALLPEKVVTTIDDALKTATEKVEVLSADAKAVAVKVEKSVRTVANRLNFDVNKARRDATRYAEDLTKKMNVTVEGLISETLHRFNVPTRRELKDLTFKVDLLGRKIDGLTAARRTAMRRVRRAA